MPLAVMEICWPAIDAPWTCVEPVTLPVVPSEVAVAVDVMLPMEMNPPSMEMPPTVAVASAVAMLEGACDEDVADRAPMPKMLELPAKGLPVPDGACWVASPLLEPAVAASLPIVAVALFPLVLLDASMFTPGRSVEAEFGVWGYSVTACRGHVGAGGSGTPGTRSASSGPALATTWPGYRVDAVAVPVGP